MTKLKPCPCCGNGNLYTGHITADMVGVICKHCGLRLGRECTTERFPVTVSREAERTKRDPLVVLDEYLLRKAITAWNTRSHNHD